jgi:hypothetical protein
LEKETGITFIEFSLRWSQSLHPVTPFSFSSALRSYELGERCPKQNTLERIAKALDVAPACFDAYGIEHYHELMHVLFLLEDRFGIEPCGKHPIYRRSNPVMRLRMAGLEGVLGEGET